VTIRRIGCLTDVPVGYGSPQIQYLLRSLARHFGTGSPTVCQPYSEAYPASHDEAPDLTFHSIRWRQATTPFWFADGGRGQERLAAGFRDWVRTERPDLLLLTGFNSLRYLDPGTDLGPRPFVVHYALEFQARQEMDATTAARHAESVEAFDLLLFSETNRRRRYNREFGTEGVAQATVLNVPPADAFPVVPAHKRNGHVLLQSASIQWDLTYPEFLATTGRPRIPFDVYGLIYDGPARILDAAEAATAFGVRYLGAVTNRELARLRAGYSYSFVAWKPAQFNTLFACPNKLFESIASGVPPITAPHPQCAEIVRTYDCGLVMRDWSFTAFCDTLENACSLLGTPRYAALVRNCLQAHRAALNWETEFDGIVDFLPSPSAGRTKPARTAARGRRS
jgi:hypothetical protein